MIHKKDRWKWICVVLFAGICLGTSKCFEVESFGRFFFYLIFYCCVIACVIKLFLTAMYIKRELPQIISNFKENKRNIMISAQIYKVKYGQRKSDLLPYTQIFCEYTDENNKKWLFKSEQFLGKIDIREGDYCKVFVENGCLNNYEVIPENYN